MKHTITHRSIQKAIALVASAAMMVACGSSTAASTSTPASTAASGAASAAEPAAVEWPTSDVNIYVASSAGSNNDLVARLAAKWMSEKNGKTFNVSNLTDGGGITAYENVRNSDPAKANEFFVNHTDIAVRYWMGQYQYNPAESFSAVGAACAGGNQAYVARADAPYNNLTEMNDYAKEHPGEVKWAVKLGNATHISVVQVMQATGTDIKCMDAGDQNTKLAGVLGGQLDVGNMTIPAAEPYLEGGSNELKILFCSQPYEDYENFIEWNDGQLDFMGKSYTYFWGPAGMDEGTLSAIDALFEEMMADPTYVEQVTTLGNGIPDPFMDHNACNEDVAFQTESKGEAATAAGLNKQA